MLWSSCCPHYSDINTEHVLLSLTKDPQLISYTVSLSWRRRVISHQHVTIRLVLFLLAVIKVKPSVLASNIMSRCSRVSRRTLLSSATYSYSNKWVWSGWVQLMRVVLLDNCTHCSGKYFSAEEIYSSWFNCSLDANLHRSSFLSADVQAVLRNPPG